MLSDSIHRTLRLSERWPGSSSGYGSQGVSNNVQRPISIGASAAALAQPQCSMKASGQHSMQKFIYSVCMLILETLTHMYTPLTK